MAVGKCGLPNRRLAAIAKYMSTATIHLNIRSFKPGGCCEIDRPSIHPADGGHRVSHKSEDPAHPHFHTIVVKSKGGDPLKLTFAITPAGEYWAHAISFTQTNGAHDPEGSANFTEAVAEKDTITVKNVFAHAGKGAAAPHWEYSIEVTQIATGLKGMIDPGIENEDT